MHVLIFGGAGFIGLNLAKAFLAQGHRVTTFDRTLPDQTSIHRLGPQRDSLTCIAGDITDPNAVRAAVRPGVDVIILAAAITSGKERDAREPERILDVNMMSHIPVLEAGRDAGVRRLINVSSAAAYGAAGERFAVLLEETPTEPVGLYAISKLASERIGNRLADLWGLDFVSVRLSGAFGPFERDTGVRDTLSPQFQVLNTLLAGAPALLPRPGMRDWTYSVDIAEAIHRIAVADTLSRRLYNISVGRSWSVLDWGVALAQRIPGAVCRLVELGEAPTIDLHGPQDRAPMSADALAADIGWRAAYGLEASARHLAEWHRGLGSAHSVPDAAIHANGPGRNDET